MKGLFLLIIYSIILPSSSFADRVDSLKQVAQKSNSAKDWNAVAYAYYNLKDTFHLGEAAQTAYLLAEKENNPGEMADALANEACVDQAAGRWNEYEQKYKKVLIYANVANRSDLKKLALDNLGDYCNAIGKYTKALAYFKKAIEVYNEDDKNVITYTNISYSYIQKGVIDSAFFYALKSRDIAMAIKDTDMICENNTKLAILSKQKSQSAKSVEYYQENLHLSELSGDYNYYILTLDNISVAYCDWKKYDKALYFARKAMNEVEKRKGAIDTDVHENTLAILGKVLMLNHQYESAIDTLKQSLLINNFAYDAYKTTLYLSSCYYALNQFDSCEFYLEKVKNMLDNNEELAALDYYLHKGKLLVKQEKYRAAIPFLQKVEELSTKFGESEMRTDIQLYEALSVAYEKGMNDFKTALHYKTMAYSVQDSIYKEENNEILADFSTRYQTVEKELEISRLNEQQQQTNFRHWLTIGAFVVLSLSLLTAWLYNRFLRQRKEKEAVVSTLRMEEKEIEYQKLLGGNERRRIESFLEGLEAERKRISSELHDNVANEVFLVHLELVKNEQPQTCVTERLGKLHAHIRDISHSLAYPAFQHVSLPEILENYLDRLNSTNHIRVLLEMNDRDRLVFLPEALSGELYRIIQEAVGNAVRHSKGNEIFIKLTLIDSQLEVSIEDNGVGFDVHKPGSGIGLQIIRERCAALHGALQIRSEVDKGTHVLVKLLHPSLQSGFDS